MAEAPAAREVRQRIVILTFQVSCAACGAVDWIDPRDCDGIALFGTVHLMPTIDQAELLVDDVHQIVPVELSR